MAFADNGFPLVMAGMLPAWVAVPIGAGVIVMIAWHVTGLRQAEMPASRRRIRAANGVVMMFVAALMTYALGVMRQRGSGGAGASPEESRAFVVVWTAVIGLLGVVLLLAVVDVLNTMRLAAGQHVRLARALRAGARRGAMTGRTPAAGTKPGSKQAGSFQREGGRGVEGGSH